MAGQQILDGFDEALKKRQPHLPISTFTQVARGEAVRENAELITDVITLE